MTCGCLFQPVFFYDFFFLLKRLAAVLFSANMLSLLVYLLWILLVLHQELNVACWSLNSNLSCVFPGSVKQVALISSAWDDKQTGFSLLQCFILWWKILLPRSSFCLPSANTLVWCKADWELMGHCSLLLSHHFKFYLFELILFETLLIN